MKFAIFAFILATVQVATFASEDQETPSIRRRAQGNGNGNGNANGLGNGYGRLLKNPCVILLADVQYADHHDEEQPMVCELQGEDLNGKSYQMVTLTNVPPGFAKNNNVESGRSTLFVSGGRIDDDKDELHVPGDVPVSIGRKGSGVSSVYEEEWTRDRKLQVLDPTVLVVRVVASDATTTATEEELSDDVFGNGNDLRNLKSQYSACSYNQMNFQKATGQAGIVDGVYTVTIPSTTVNGVDNGNIRNAVTNQLQSDFGTSSSNVADYVMLCLPPGTNGGWIAYAYINSWLSVYNNQWCGYVSAQMHEIGHNLGLAHAGEGTQQYADQSGMMGYSYGSSDTPEMCFNGAKSYQLGWFDAYHVDLPSLGNLNWQGDLIGMVERGAANPQDKMIIRINGDSESLDYYVHFNRKTGFNSGSVEGGNQVLVASRSEGTGYAASTLLAKMNAGGVYTIGNFDNSGQDLTITVNSLTIATTPGRANISIQFGSPTPSPVAPVTPSPVAPPTPSPVAPPTPSPVAPPTPSPVAPPTPSPVAPPTPSPVAPPTPSPVAPPTPSPVAPPTPSPVVPVTPSPVVPITPSPVVPVTPSPVVPITPSPVVPITPSPVVPITPSPVAPTGPTPCVDDPNWLSYNSKNCNFVSNKPYNKNGGRCFLESVGGVLALDACPVACGTCP